MNLLEHQGKHLLAAAGLRVPSGELVTDADAAASAVERRGGRAVCKAQVATGKRGKAGAVRLVQSAAEAHEFAAALLGADVDGHQVHTLLVEDAVDIAVELYAAVLDDPTTKGPRLLFSLSGGMDIEEVHAHSPELIHALSVDIRRGIDPAAVAELLASSADSGLGSGDSGAVTVEAVVAALVDLYGVYLDVDASLVEVNPLVVTTTGEVVVVDAKITIDPGSVPRQRERLAELPGGLPDETGTALEQRGRELDLTYIELDGDVGVLANGAGLTMTTLDAVHHLGGRPANFLEIGGDAYTRATPALELVLSNPRVKSLLVNFCGAFARTDVMAGGVVDAIEQLKPTLPIVFTIHGTGEAEAIALVQERLGVDPYDQMDDAVRAAVDAAAAVATS